MGALPGYACLPSDSRSVASYEPFEELHMADPQFPAINVPGTGKLYARLHTTQGPIVVELEEARAPKTVANFVGLATGTMAWKDEHTGTAMQNEPLYKGVKFHRVIPNFMVQC